MFKKLNKVKVLEVSAAVMSLAVSAHATGEYFTLPSDFETNAIATIGLVVTALLGVRVMPVAWKYLVQFFGKKNA